MSKWHSAEQNNPVNCFVRGLSKTMSATNKLAEEMQIKQKIDVEVAELVDAHDSGSCGSRLEGSSPFFDIFINLVN